MIFFGKCGKISLSDKQWTEATDHVYAFDTPQNIRRIVEKNPSETHKIFLSEDGEKWLYLGTSSADGLINQSYPAKFQHVKALGNGEIAILTDIEKNTLTVTSGKTITLYPYFKGEPDAAASLEDNSGCVAIDGTKITGQSPVGAHILKLTYGNGESVDYNLSVSLALLKVNYEMSESSTTINLSSDGLNNVPSKTTVMILNPDRTVKYMNTFATTFADGAETLTIPVAVQPNEFAKVMVWDDITLQNAYTKVVNTNF